MRRLWTRRRGFTLVEMLVTIVILGILASIAFKVIDAKRNAFIATMKSDLRNLASAEEAYFYDNSLYTSVIGDGMGNSCDQGRIDFAATWMGCPGVDWRPSPGVRPQLYGDAMGFSGRMTHQRITDQCALYRGLPTIVYLPAAEDGTLVCDDAPGSGMGMGMDGP